MNLEPLRDALPTCSCHPDERPDHCPRKFALAECRKAEIARMREVIEAWHNIDRKRDAEIERLKQLLGEIGQACALADKKYDLPDEISGHLYSRCIRASLGVEEPSHDER